MPTWIQPPCKRRYHARQPQHTPIVRNEHAKVGIRAGLMRHGAWRAAKFPEFPLTLSLKPDCNGITCGTRTNAND